MSEMQAALPALSLLVGLLIGIFGGGAGSIVAPLLVLLTGVESRLGGIAGLVVAGAASLAATWSYNEGRNLGLRTGLVVALAISAVEYGINALEPALPASLPLLLLTVLLLAPVWPLLARHDAQDPPPTRLPIPLLLAMGIGIGVLVGICGHTANLLIVPALILIGGLETKRAVGTSLLVVALTSAASFAQRFVERGTIVQLETTMVGSLPLLGYIAIIAVTTSVGSLIGSRLSRRLDPVTVRRGYALLLLAVALFSLVQSLGLL